MKKIFMFALGPVIGALLGFITLPVISHFISTEQYGMSSLFQVTYNFLYSFILLGYDQAFMREFNEEENKKKLFFNCAFPCFIFAIALCFFIIMFKEQLALLIFGNSEYFVPIVLLGICMPLFIIEKFLLLSLRMSENGKKYSFWNIFSKLLYLIILIALIALGERSFLCITYSLVFTQIITSILIFIFDGKDVSVSIKVYDKKLFKKTTKYALPLIPIVVINWAMSSLDTIFLKYFSDFYNVGIYSMAYKFVNIIMIIQTSFCLVWSPISYRWKKEKKNNNYFQIVILIMSFIMMEIFTGTMLFKPVINIILSSQYYSCIYIIPFLLFYPIFVTVSETTTLGIPFTRKSYLNVIISIVSIVTNCLLNYILIPKYGAIGAAIATGLSYCMFFWLRTLFSRKLWFNFKLNNLIFFTIVLLINGLLNVFIKNIYIISIINLLTIIIIFLYYNNLIIPLLNKLEKKDKVNVLLIAYPNQYNKLKNIIENDNIVVNKLNLSKCNKIQKLIEVIKSFVVNDYIYFGYGQNKYNYYLMVAKFFQKNVIMHWIGSDVLIINKKDIKKINKVVKYHFACSKLIKLELAEKGIETIEVPIVPNFVHTEIANMPSEHAVLVYLPKEKEDFYGGRLISELSKRYKEIKFYILANDNFEKDNSNIINLGYVDENKMLDVYNKISILIRIPEHDGLSLMLLESLMKGKEVIYCYDFPYTHKATNFEELNKVFDKIIKNSPTKNIKGHDYIIKEYDLIKIKKQVTKIIVGSEKNEES